MAASCHLCGAKCTDDDYCEGCGCHICAACDHSDPDKRPQVTAHEPEAHRAHQGAPS